MAVGTTYEKLVDSIQVYLNRYDEDTLRMIPLFINTAEKNMLRNLRMPSMEKMVLFTLKDAGDNDYPVEEGLVLPNEWVRLPTDFIEMKFIWVECKTLQRVTFDQLITNGSDGDPYDKPFNQAPVFAINAGRLFVKGVEQDTPIKMTYYADFPEISETVSCNPLLQLLPDGFLYLAVAEGFRFLMEEERATYWEQLGMAKVNAVQAQVDNAEFAGSPLVINPMESGFRKTTVTWEAN